MNGESTKLAAGATLYARVIVPRPLEEAFTYIVPQSMISRIAVGKRVVVPFGAKRFVTGVVESLSPVRPADVASFKEVVELLDSNPSVIHPQLKFWRWIADYYMCPIGDVYKAAVPAALKLESESVVDFCSDADPTVFSSLSDFDMKIVEAVKAKGKLSLRELARSLKTGSLEARVERLVGLGLLSMHESMVNRYRRVKVQKVKPLFDIEGIAGAFESVKRSRGQQETLTHLIALSGVNSPVAPTKAVAKASLLEASPAITWDHVNSLRKKGLVEVETYELSRFSAPDESGDAFSAPLPSLSDAQKKALDEIHREFLTHSVTLLRGVTSSGKTEIYIHLIDYVLRQGRQVLFLVPEIALTTQLTRRLQRVFGSKVIIYHSKFSDNERVDIWRACLENREPYVVIGARSAVFLPFTNLGMVIVDEEHEPGYKQYDPAPRYNARDAAIVLATYHGAKTLLGSATPTVESYYKASELGKYGFVELTARYGDVELPEIRIVDMAREYKSGGVEGALANVTISEARKNMKSGHQVIFFHNRRGFSPRARCSQCQFVPKCDHCDVALTFHKRTNTLECHYCGTTYPVPKVCPNCHEPAIRIEGFGTERVEENVDTLFPEARVLRMDLDTTRNKDAYADIIDNFSAHRADILVGTQMVTKGLDFSDVGMVGVINADNIINFPDFRATERAFNMLEQVAGRAGRRAGHLGEVLIQTRNPSHPVIDFVTSHDYSGFYAWELEQRRAFCYPPFSRIINIYVKHRDRAVVDEVARDYVARLRVLLGNRVNGPIEPPVERVASLFIRQVMLRIETDASIARVKEILRHVFVEMNAGVTRSGATLHYDVDPA